MLDQLELSIVNELIGIMKTSDTHKCLSRCNQYIRCQIVVSSNNNCYLYNNNLTNNQTLFFMEQKEPKIYQRIPGS